MSHYSRRWAGAATIGTLVAFGCGTGSNTPGDGTGGTLPGSGASTASGGSSGGAATGGAPSGGGNTGGAQVGSGGGATGGSGGASPTGGAGGIVGSGGSGAADTGGVAGGGGSTTVLADVTVSAGTLKRDHTIVSFQYSAGQGQTLALRDPQGAELPVQVDANGSATFILPALAAGEVATYVLVPLGAASEEGVTATAVDGVVRLAIGSSTVADFKTVGQPPPGADPANVRAGYLHPVYTPAGKVVTDDYPDDAGSHGWHHGIWTAWTQAEFNGHVLDFWNAYKNEGSVDLDSVDATWQGPVHAGLDAKLVHVDLFGGAKTTALNERWVVRAYKTHSGTAPYFVLDLESTQTTATTAPLRLLEWDYGGFALRGNAEWKDAAKANFIASDGRDRISGNWQHGRWCFLGGTVGGQAVGFAGLGHPSNFRAPQTLRIHPTDPYMAFAPVYDGEVTIEPGTPYVTRLRFVTADGEPDPALLDRL